MGDVRRSADRGVRTAALQQQLAILSGGGGDHRSSFFLSKYITDAAKKSPL